MLVAYCSAPSGHLCTRSAAITIAALTAQESIDHKNSAELGQLLDMLPARIRDAAHAAGALESTLEEIILDEGRPPELRFSDRDVDLDIGPVTPAELTEVVGPSGSRLRFGKDNRAALDGMLHRVSRKLDGEGHVNGLTLRVGRDMPQLMPREVAELLLSGRSVLFLGPPGVGKTTLLRGACRLVSQAPLDPDGRKRRAVAVIDTSNEIAGDGHIPHESIGRSRKMFVPDVQKQYQVMIEAVENHGPNTVVIDEIGNAAEAEAAVTIAQRGVQLIGTAHGHSLWRLIRNKALVALVGGLDKPTVGDDEKQAHRYVSKNVYERMDYPPFDAIVEIPDRDHYIIHEHAALAIDTMLGAMNRGQFGVDGQPLMSGPGAPKRYSRNPAPERDLAGVVNQHLSKSERRAARMAERNGSPAVVS